MIISDDNKWLNAHVEYVVAKAAKILYAPRLLKRADVMPKNILKVHLCNVRSVLEYAAQVWQDIPAYLSEAIESTVRPVLSGHPRDFEKWPFNRGWPLNRGTI